MHTMDVRIAQFLAQPVLCVTKSMSLPWIDRIVTALNRRMFKIIIRDEFPQTFVFFYYSSWYRILRIVNRSF